MTTNYDDDAGDVLSRLGACAPAVSTYVGHAMSEAQALWDTCDSPYWMVWLIARCAPASWRGCHKLLRLFLALWDEVRPASKRDEHEVAFLAKAAEIQGGPDFFSLVRALRAWLLSVGDLPRWRHSARAVLRAVLGDTDREDVAIAAHRAIDSMLWNWTYTSASTLCTVIRGVHPQVPDVYKAVAE